MQIMKSMGKSDSAPCMTQSASSCSSRLTLQMEPFGRLTATQSHELDDQGERIGEFLEGKPQLTIGTVAIGGHA
ncbi:MAG TPA: hypothetical protein VF043_17480 [Ktedonobacteraceae bacterium]